MADQYADIDTDTVRCIWISCFGALCLFIDMSGIEQSWSHDCCVNNIICSCYFLCDCFCDADADTDVDFDPMADMLVHDYDDERTLDEEEAMSNEESVANELDDLQKVSIEQYTYL